MWSDLHVPFGWRPAPFSFECASVDFRRVAGSLSSAFRPVFGAICISLVVGAQRSFLLNVQVLIFVG